MKLVTTTDEAERAFMMARYGVGDEELAERTTGAADMGGSLLAWLNAFMERKMTVKSTKTWRELGDIHLQDARQPELSKRIDAGEAGANTAKRRMSMVIGFYRWLKLEEVLLPKHDPWKESERFIGLTDQHGL